MIYKALASFQQEVPVIIKETEGYGYNYADLPAVFEVINPLLQKHGLGFYQAVEGSQMKTVVFHIDSGESIQSITDMPFDSLIYETVERYDKYDKTTKTVSVIKGFEGMNKAQAIGSLITYFRRYTLSALLGLVTDKDTDGTGTESQYVKPLVKPVVAKVIQNAREGKPTNIKDFEEAFTDPETGEVIYDQNYREMNEAKKANKRELRSPKKDEAYRDSVFNITLQGIQHEKDKSKLDDIKVKIEENKVLTAEQKEQLIKLIDSK